MNWRTWVVRVSLASALLGSVFLGSVDLTHATVTTTTPRNDYVGTGSVATYAYTFRIFASSDLRVTKRDTAGVETALVLTTDYTVTGVNKAAGGTITLVAGNLPSNYALTIRFDRTPQQSTDLRNQGGFFAETHETKFDELTRYAQQLNDTSNRSLKIPETETGGSSVTTLPTAILRANKYLKFDSSGKAGTADPASASGTSVTSTGSTTARMLADRFAEVKNVHDFGAVGDGVTDDGPAFQRTHDALAASGASTITTNPNTTYAIKTQVNVSRARTLFLLHPSTVIDTTGIAGTGTANVHNTVNVLAAFKVTAADVEFESGRFTGPVTSDGGKQVCGILLAAGANRFTARSTHMDGMYTSIWPGGGITDLKLVDLDLDGLARNLHIGYQEGVAGGAAQVNRGEFLNLHSRNSTNDGLKLAAFAEDIAIIGGQYHNNGADGIDMFIAGEFVQIIGVHAYNNTLEGIDIKTDSTLTGEGAGKGGYNRRSIITENILADNANRGLVIGAPSFAVGTEPVVENFIISDNIAYSNTAQGFWLEGLRRSTVSGNLAIENGGRGFQLRSVLDIAFIGNQAIQNNQTVNIEGINFGRHSGAAAPANTRVRAIGNIAVGSGAASAQQNGFDMNLADVINSVFIGNSANNHNTANWNLAGTSSTTVFRDNEGLVTENSGTGTINSGATTATITHGLGRTPAAKDIFVTFTENPTSDPGNIWISGITSTQFIVNVRTDPGASNLDFSWRAIVVTN